MLADMVLEELADARLAPQLDCCIVQGVLNEALRPLLVAFRIVLTWQEILFDEIPDLDVFWWAGLVLKLARLNIFDKQLRSEQPPSCELVKSLGASLRNKMSPLTGQLLVTFVVSTGSERLKLLLEERFVEVDEHVVVTQISLIFSIVNLLDIIL